MRNRQFIILFLSVVNVMVGYGLVIPFVSLYQNYFGVTILMTGLLISFYALGQFIFAPIAGDLISRYGERRILVISQIIFGICTIFVFTIHVFGIMLFFRFLTGMCAACIYSASEHYVATKSKPEIQTRMLMLLSVASGVGIIIGPLLGVYIVEFAAISYNLSENQVLNATALLALAFAIYIFLITFLTFISFPKKFEKSKYVKEVKFISFFPNLIKQIYQQCRTPKMIFILTGFFLYGYITSSVEAYFLDFALKNYQIDRFLIGIEGLILLLFGIVFFFKIGPLLEKRYKTITLLIIYLFIPCFAFFILEFIPPLSIFFPMFVIIMATISIFSSQLISFISKESENPGIVLGFKNSIISVGMILGPIISGYFYGTSPQNFMLQIAVALTIVAIFGIVIRRKYYRMEN